MSGMELSTGENRTKSFVTCCVLKIYEDGLFDSFNVLRAIGIHRAQGVVIVLLCRDEAVVLGGRRKWFLCLLSRNLTNYGLNLLQVVSKYGLHYDETEYAPFRPLYCTSSKRSEISFITQKAPSYGWPFFLVFEYHEIDPHEYFNLPFEFPVIGIILRQRFSNYLPPNI